MKKATARGILGTFAAVSIAIMIWSAYMGLSIIAQESGWLATIAFVVTFIALVFGVVWAAVNAD